MSKILVTGAGGFIGKALVTKLTAQGCAVLPMDSSDGNLANRDTLTRFTEQNVSHVFHLAGKTFVPDSWEDPLTFCQTNVLGTTNVLEFCRKNSTPLTYVSAYVYGHPDHLPISEDSTIQPSNPYALTKRLAEEICEFYSRAYDIPVTTIRPFNVYGIGQSALFLVPAIISQVLDDSEKIVVKDLAPKRDYVYLEDLVAALLATVNKPSGYRVFNIGSGVSLSVQEVIDVVQASAGTNKKVVCDNVVRTNELMDVVADISKAWEELGWHPEFSFRAGIEKIIHSELDRKTL